jgi:hypothetical protein
MAFTIMTQGSFVSDGTNKKVVLQGGADYFLARNLTKSGASSTGAVLSEWYGNGLTAVGGSLATTKAGSNALLQLNVASPNGFTYVSVSPFVEAPNANAITAITAASPAVVSQVNTYNNGDILRITGTTGMLQYGGMLVEISSVSGTGYTLLGVRAAGLTAGTAGTTRRVSALEAVEPQFLYVTEVTKAANAVVRCSVNPGRYYAVGMKVTFSVPQSFGMVELNGLTGVIKAIDPAAYTMTVDIDSSAFTTFAFPLTTSSPSAALFACVAPAGQSAQKNYITGVETGYDVTKAPFQLGQATPYMLLAAGANGPAGETGDVIVWQAYKAEATFYP